MNTNTDLVLIEDHIKRLQDSMITIEHNFEKLSKEYEESQKTFEKLLKECNISLGHAKAELNKIVDIADHCGLRPLPEIPIKDAKLQEAWKALYRYHDGATADMIAAYLGKHRTTVSTYLNMLEAENLAQKYRIGHVIYYKAVLQRDE